MCCATFTAAAHEDWSRRREGWCRLGTAFWLWMERGRAALRCGHVERRVAEENEAVCCRAIDVANRRVRLVIEEEFCSSLGQGMADPRCN